MDTKTDPDLFTAVNPGARNKKISTVKIPFLVTDNLYPGNGKPIMAECGKIFNAQQSRKVSGRSL
jgi:hypothetical protein